jgi:hypothetical protein
MARGLERWEVEAWIEEILARERANTPSPELQNTVGSGMYMGAIEVLEEFKTWLNEDGD